jgi:hypothetical protein
VLKIAFTGLHPRLAQIALGDDEPRPTRAGSAGMRGQAARRFAFMYDTKLA